MGYTPVELRHVRLRRGLFGYKRNAVEELLEATADSFEQCWSERGELADKVEELDKNVDEVKHREDLLTHALVAAEQAAVDVRERAKREAELIVTEAHSEARTITRQAQADRERLFNEMRRIEAMLRAALGMVDGSAQQLVAEAGSAVVAAAADRPLADLPDDVPAELATERPAEPEPASNVELWPHREDTREFLVSDIRAAAAGVQDDVEAQAG
jgi:cell division initiation protein